MKKKMIRPPRRRGSDTPGQVCVRKRCVCERCGHLFWNKIGNCVGELEVKCDKCKAVYTINLALRIQR